MSNPFLPYYELLNRIETSMRLGDICFVETGHYPRFSSALVLRDCSWNSTRVTAFSRSVERYVELPEYCVHPFVSDVDIDAFGLLGNKDAVHEKGLVMSPDNYLPTQLSHYLLECEMKEGLREGTIELPKRADMQLGEKLIVAIDIKRGCASAYDNDGDYTYGMGAYGLFPISMNWGENKWKLLWAITNSRLFNYYFFSGTQEFRDTSRRWKYDLLCGFPIPDYDASTAAIVSLLSDCIHAIVHDPIRDYTFSYDSKPRELPYLLDILNLVVYELYFPRYMKERALDVIDYLYDAPFQKEMPIYDKIRETYRWVMKPNNVIRQRMLTLDTRSMDLLYPIQLYTERYE